MTHIDMDDDDDRLLVVREADMEESLRLECLRMAIDVAPNGEWHIDLLATAESFVAFVKGRVN
jgi:hypothetical protein